MVQLMIPISNVVLNKKMSFTIITKQFAVCDVSQF